ncbi:cell growth-regulating nucleolar [Brachionus plicatilis]|uniref:Cell growth-regulating nucleolar n=1 Tax=Brachionus plicatilis TaxID=10195 RepID=A0A3M7RJE5_BRAPC|nr:cell growth-regulating nucleolar [Brachionus plicatilis]
MVYFNCCQCGTGLRKNQVETHMRACRSRLFSCIDCQKDFKNEEYKSHVKCLTESERYESKDYVAKQNKGDVKQNAWFEKVLKAVESFKGSPKAKSLLQKLTDYPNVPRKKAKFFNFIRNSFRSFNLNQSQLEEIWNVIESFDKADKNTNGNNLKRKLEDSVEQDEKNEIEIKKPKDGDVNEDKSSDDFDWIEVLKKECIKHQDCSVSFEKLEKKVFKKYKKFKSNENEQNEEIVNDMEKFRKKLNKKLKKLSHLFSLTENDSNLVVKYSDANNNSIS